ncbi:ALP1-like protein [Tanacetum coccineum]
MSSGNMCHRGTNILTENYVGPTVLLGIVAGERIPVELSPSNIPQRHVARERYPQRQVARESPELSLGIVVNVCTSAIRKIAYGAVPDALDEYLQMGATTTCKCLQLFCKAVMELYGEEFLQKPTYIDMEKLYSYHEENHEFPRMLGSIDCTCWPWENCPVAFKAQFYRGDHGPDHSFY